MSPLGRVSRRPDQWSSPHERARVRSAERIDSALDPLEAVWLDEHLAGCDDCRAVAAAYDTDRLALRALRDDPPEPPRDLWARTAAGIEREASGRRAGRRASGRSGIPLGALTGVAVVAVVVGASLLSGRWLDRPVPDAPPTSGVAVAPSLGPTPSPAATPIRVEAGPVAWIGTRDGQVAVNRAIIDEVCAADDQPNCAALDDLTASVLSIKNRPKSIIGSPDEKNAVVVASDEVIVVVLPTPAPTPAPAETASSTETATTSPSSEPSETPSETPLPTDTSASADPSPSVDPNPSASPDPSPTISPEPSVALELAIASGVTVVGDSAAFSADGAWFAFTARPSDGSAGPDIYVWHVGDTTAVPLTTDGVSVFASWDGDRIIGSRPASDATTEASAPVSVRIDPATGAEDGTPTDVWRPVVDPTGRFAVAWDGTVLIDPTTHEPWPATGTLTLTSWSADGAGSDRTPIDLGDAALAHVDVRWDETGTWLAIWTGGADDPTIGRLSLYRLDPETGTLDQPDGAPTDVPALPGFSIGSGRLAWVTPKGQDAEGSKVQVVAWNGADVGAVESVPGEDVIVVR
jgi:Putative zinc-finger